MTEDQLKNLKPKDIIRHKSTGDVYIVMGDYCGRVTAVRAIDVTNPIEWDLIPPKPNENDK